MKFLIVFLVVWFLVGCNTPHITIDIPCAVQFAYKDIVHPTPAPTPKTKLTPGS